MVYPALLPLMRTPQLPLIYSTPPPADLTGLVRFAERRNLVSARVPSHFKCSLRSNRPQSLPTEHVLTSIQVKRITDALHIQPTYIN